MIFLYRKIILVIILIFSISISVGGLFNFNPVDKITKNKILKTIIYIIVIIAAITSSFFLFKRDFNLPFLGKAVYPCKSLKEKIPLNHNTSVTINTIPNSNVVYWAAEPEQIGKKTNNVESWTAAYQNYSNSGVVRSNSSGIAELKFRKPRSYKVPYKGKLDKHVHYRVCKKDGMLSRVQTINL